MYTFIATAAFGIESTVKREVARLGYPISEVQDGRISFKGELCDITRANIWLRSADRVQLVVGEFEADTFDALFEGVKALPWGDFITKDGRFIVTGKSVKSKLFSVPDCQRIAEKALVEKLKEKYNVDWFEKTGPEYKIQVALLKDKVTVTLDTTGAGLHKRGYRPSAVAAPMKETMAAALVELSYWKKDKALFDPFCGSGTIVIEAALMARNIAPGIKRRFVSERWPQIPKKAWQDARAEALDSVDKNFVPRLYGSDISEEAVRLARMNAENAGVGDCTHFSVADAKELILPEPSGVLITNPPYGERAGDAAESKRLYKRLGEIMQKEKSWPVYVITPDEDFERLFGRKADTRRKLFNGMLKTDYYQYTGKKPGR